MDRGKQRSISILLLIVALAFVGLYEFWPEKAKKNSKESRPIRAASPEAQAIVNRHLWLASQTQELAQRKRELENSYQSLQVGDSIWPKGNGKSRDLGVDHSPDRDESNAYDDLNRYRKEFRANNPDHIIQGQIADEELQRQYTEEYRAEYARQFVENARQHGYLVQLNDDLVVVNVTKIATPTERNPSNSYSGPQAK